MPFSSRFFLPDGFGVEGGGFVGVDGVLGVDGVDGVLGVEGGFGFGICRLHEEWGIPLERDRMHIREWYQRLRLQDGA